jgi:signal transduction histidine kinase
MSKGNGMIEISVSDTGPGIKMEDKCKLFKLFGFLEDTKEINPRGIGLGLHISQKISLQLGGEIVLDSEPG